MGDEDRRLAQLPLQPPDLVLHVPPDQRVERGERLVEQQDLGIVGQGPGQPHPLLHAAAQLVGVGVAQAAEADQLQHLAGPLEPAGLVLALHLQAEGDVVEEAAVGEQAEVLEDHAHLGAPQLAEALGAGRGDVLAVDEDLARRRLDQARQAADERRLARAREPHDDEQLAAGDRERDVPHGRHVADAGQLGPGQVGHRRADDALWPRPEHLPDVAALEDGRRRRARCRPFRCRSRSCRLVVSGRSQVHGSPLAHAGSVLHRFRRLSLVAGARPRPRGGWRGGRR